MDRKVKMTVENSLLVLVIGIFLAFTLVPILWTFISSLKKTVDILKMPPVWIFKPTLDNYRDAFVTANLGHYFVNSVIVALGSTVLSIAAGSLFAYSITRFRVPGGSQLAFFILLTRMFPPISATLPIFLIMQRLRLVDTHICLIIAHTSFTLPFVVWIMRGFFLGIPVDLDEAAMIDGCGRLGALFRVVLPVSIPGLVATSIFAFIGSWNDFFFALILSRTRSPTLPVAVGGFITERGVWWGQINAASSFIMIPVLVFTILIQKQLVRGLASGAVKG